MIEINSTKIEEAVYNLCIQANTVYNQDLYNKIYKKYVSSKTEASKTKYANILKNIELAKKLKRPLCQDTGQVLVFIKLSHDVVIKGQSIKKAINNAVEKAYTDNFYRKSVVNNAVFNRNNTLTNTPAVIYTEFFDKNEQNVAIEIFLLIKGAGSENYSALKMFKPTSDKKEIFKFVKDSIIAAGEKSCPPLVLGIGIGGTMDSAAVMSKKAFFKKDNTKEEIQFIEDLNNFLRINALSEDTLDIKIDTTSTHIACLPVALTINCHSTRHSHCTINHEKIEYDNTCLNFEKIEINQSQQKEVFTGDIETVKNLKKGENVLLTGEIYTARDAAHKKIKEYFEKHNKLPFDLNDKIFFYAGPCPAAPNEIIGPIGPTTSARMDEFCEFMHSQGLLASIGKGERSDDASASIKKYNSKYFTAQGGVACLLSKCVKKSEVAAFEELGTEAVRKLYIEKFPVFVEI